MLLQGGDTRSLCFSRPCGPWRAMGTPGRGLRGFPGSRRPLVSVVLNEAPPPCASLGRPGRPLCPPRLPPRGPSRGQVQPLCGAGLDDTCKTQGQHPRAEVGALSWLLELPGVDLAEKHAGLWVPRNACERTRSRFIPEGATCPGQGAESGLNRELGCRPASVPRAQDGRGVGSGAGAGQHKLRRVRVAVRAGERPSL